MSDEGRIEVSGVSVGLPILSAGLLQRCTDMNSWHCDKTAAISSEYRGSFSIRNNFPGPMYHYHYFTQPPLASSVAL